MMWNMAIMYLKIKKYSYYMPFHVKNSFKRVAAVYFNVVYPTTSMCKNFHIYYHTYFCVLLCVLWDCHDNTIKGTVHETSRNKFSNLNQSLSVRTPGRLTSSCGGARVTSVDKPRLSRALQPENTHWLRNAGTLRYVKKTFRFMFSK